MTWRKTMAERMSKVATDVFASLVPESLKGMVDLDIKSGRLFVPYALVLPRVQDMAARITKGQVRLEVEPVDHGYLCQMEAEGYLVELHLVLREIEWRDQVMTVQVESWEIRGLPSRRGLTWLVKAVQGMPYGKQGIVSMVARFLPPEVTWSGSVFVCSPEDHHLETVPAWLHETSVRVKLVQADKGLWLDMDLDLETFPKTVGWILSLLVKKQRGGDSPTKPAAEV